MSINAGPKIIDSDSLILYLDVANERSYPISKIGPNLYNNIYNNTRIKSELFPNESHLGEPVYKITSLDDRSGYPTYRIGIDSFYDTFFVSGYIKTGDVSLNFSVDRSDSQTQGLTTSIEWKRFSYTFTQREYLYGAFMDFNIDGLNTNGHYLYVSNIQMNKYIANDIINDLTDNKNDGTLYGITYSEDSMGCLVFDGITGHTVMSGGSPIGDCTIEFVIKHFNDNYDRCITYKDSFEIKHIVNQDNIYFLRRVNNTGATFGDSLVSGYTGIYQTLLSNEIAYITFTQNSTTGEFKSYKNGILTRTVDGFYNNSTGLSTGYSGLNETQGSFKIGY